MISELLNRLFLFRLSLPFKVSTARIRIISQDGYPPATKETKIRRQIANKINTGCIMTADMDILKTSRPLIVRSKILITISDKMNAKKQTRKLSNQSWKKSFDLEAPIHFRTPISRLRVNAAARLIFTKLKQAIKRMSSPTPPMVHS